MNADEWLKARTIYCEKLKLRLTPQACADLRKRAVKWKMDIDGPPQPCLTCTGLMGVNTATQEEKAMPEEPCAIERKSYTRDDIARLASVSSKVVCDALKLLRAGAPCAKGAVGQVGPSCANWG